MLGSERKLKRPEEHIPPRLRRKLPSIKISAEGREIRDQRATYSTAARVIRTAAVAAVMELRMYCQRCYVRYVLRTVSTAAAAVFLPFYAATLWVIASPCVRITVAGNYPAFCGTRVPTHTHTPAPSRITTLHLLAATTDGPPEGFPGQEYQVDRDRRYDDVSSWR